MQKVRLHKTVGKLAVICVLTASLSFAQSYKTVEVFNGTNGGNPSAPLIQGVDENLYGTTYAEGAFGGGTIFKVSPNGLLTTLYNFCTQSKCLDGQNPLGALVAAPGGKLYGTTSLGGAYNAGTVFSFNNAGGLKTIYNFCPGGGFCFDGALPNSLLIGPDGNFYGSTESGGHTGGGTLFRITAGGVETPIYDFCLSSCADGNHPNGVTLGLDGNFYGTTVFGGGAYDTGTIFKITPQGAETTLYQFCGSATCPYGETFAGLINGADGNLYGVTGFGGQFGGGVVFKVTPDGALSTIYSFCAQSGCSDGLYPYGALVVGSDGNFYGTTQSEEIHCSRYCGTIFQLTPQGVLTTLHRFCGQKNCTDGWEPRSALLQATSGKFYGVTNEGGSYTSPCPSYGCGTLFGFSIGLSPFVSANPNVGKVGGSVAILGTNLSDTTSVTFNGVPANFSVLSASAISAQVPAGATTGTIIVTTPSETLSSNVAFEVLP